MTGARGAAEVVNIGQSSDVVVGKLILLARIGGWSCGNRAGERRKRRHDR